MATLLDTNVLVRFSQPDTEAYSLAVQAVKRLFRAGDQLYVCAQNVVEFWGIATNPEGPPDYGLGLSAEAANAEVEAFEKFFSFLPDSLAVFVEWRELALQAAVAGSSVHDARLLALMRVHRIPQLLTFDSSSYSPFVESGLTIAGLPLRIIHPAELISGR